MVVHMHKRNPLDATLDNRQLPLPSKVLLLEPRLVLKPTQIARKINISLFQVLLHFVNIRQNDLGHFFTGLTVNLLDFEKSLKLANSCEVVKHTDLVGVVLADDACMCLLFLNL